MRYLKISLQINGKHFYGILCIVVNLAWNAFFYFYFILLFFLECLFFKLLIQKWTLSHLGMSYQLLH